MTILPLCAFPNIGYIKTLLAEDVCLDLGENYVKQSFRINLNWLAQMAASHVQCTWLGNLARMPLSHQSRLLMMIGEGIPFAALSQAMGIQLSLSTTSMKSRS